MAVSEGTQEELERQRARWWATVSSGDLDGYLALFAEDAVWVTPELDEIVGREAIRAWLEPVFAQFDYELTITVADVRVAGTLGIERARFVSRMTPKPPSARPLPVTPPAEVPVAPEPAEVEPDAVVADEDAPESEPLVGDEAGLIVVPDGPGVDGDAPDTEDAPEAGSAPSDEVEEPAVEVEQPAVEVEEPAVEAPLVPAGPDAAEDEPHEGRYLMYWRWHEDAGWLVHRYADVTGVG